MTDRCQRKWSGIVPKTEIIKIKGDWQEVVDDCRSTVGKESLGKEPSAEFKRGILIAEHSPIRDIIVKWRWRSIKSWIATHWSRHKWECFISTQREDRTGIPRDCRIQSEPVTFLGEANTQHLIDTMRRRLCCQAAAETRAFAEDLKDAIRESQPEIADVLVPNCVYRMGCPEMNGCGYLKKLEEYCLREYGHSIRYMDINERYAVYNEYRRRMHGTADALEKAR